MAKYKRESGKIGPVIVYDRYGEEIVRKHVIPKDPQTEAQLAQRMKLSLANKGLAPLRDVIKVGYQGNSKAFNMLIKQTMKEFITGEYPDLSIDYSRIKIAEGKLRLPDNIAYEGDEETNCINISWSTDNTSMPKINKGSDRINLICLNRSSLATHKFYNIAQRKAGTAQISLPENRQIKDYHFWIYLTSHDWQDNSESWYLD